MADALFLCGAGTFLTVILVWGFRRLPREEWQFIAAIPAVKRDNGVWQGVNFTYYGLLIAVAQVISVTMMLVLLGSLGITVEETFGILAVLVILCLAAAKLIAHVVERKKHTFTVGGATFVGMLAAPLVLAVTNRLLTGRGVSSIPVMPFLAAAAISYAFGEAVGRLACISFGCCYGKPLAETHPLSQWLFRRLHLIFSGKTKKIAYEAGLDGHAVIPVQALTSVLYTVTGLVSTGLFLGGHYGIAFLLAVLVTQVWRVLSEFLRADYRGGGRISAYQIMALASIPYACLISIMTSGATFHPAHIGLGLSLLWNPAAILFLQLVGLAVFIYFGKSRVSGATLSFHIHPDRI